MLPIQFLPPAEKYFKKLKEKPLKNKFKDAINQIRKDPYIGKRKVGDLAGIYGFDVYYNKTNYELAYSLVENENGEIIVVIMVGTRENFWDAVKKYMV